MVQLSIMMDSEVAMSQRPRNLSMAYSSLSRSDSSVLTGRFEFRLMKNRIPPDKLINDANIGTCQLVDWLAMQEP